MMKYVLIVLSLRYLIPIYLYSRHLVVLILCNHLFTMLCAYYLDEQGNTMAWCLFSTFNPLYIHKCYVHTIWTNTEIPWHGAYFYLIFAILCPCIKSQPVVFVSLLKIIVGLQLHVLSTYIGILILPILFGRNI